MAVYTDNPACADALLREPRDRFVPCPDPPAAVTPLLDSLLAGDVGSPRPPLHTARLDPHATWRTVIVREHAPDSQYERLIALARDGEVPDRTACLAVAGRGFRGSKGRAWSALAGNIHLSVHLAPMRAVSRPESAFTALAAVALAETLDTVPGLAGRARIKWVNDVLLDGAKVGGVLAYSLTQAAVVRSVVLGIGLNVECTPRVERSAFVPAAACVRDFAAVPVSAGDVLAALLAALDRNYRLLLAAGHGPVLERYRERSAVLGEEVTVWSEDGTSSMLASGRVEAVGDGLELHVRGREEPVTRGRLVMNG